MFLSLSYFGFPNCLDVSLALYKTVVASAPLTKDMAPCGEVMFILECSGEMMHFPRLLWEVPIGVT